MENFEKEINDYIQAKENCQGKVQDSKPLELTYKVKSDLLKSSTGDPVFSSYQHKYILNSAHKTQDRSNVSKFVSEASTQDNNIHTWLEKNPHLISGSDSNASSISLPTVESKSLKRFNLRKLVKSQTKLNDYISTAIEDLDSTLGSMRNNLNCPKTKPPKEKPQNGGKYCQCNNFVKKTEENAHLKVTIDDLVEAHIINPLLQKFHRKHVETLQEEIILMDELANLPRKVIDLYKVVNYK